MNNTKTLVGVIIGLLLVILTITLALADTCSIQDICRNQNEEAFCGPNDTTCVYTYHKQEGNNCVVSLIEADSDSDGWTNSCDAFPEDATETIDFDGDTVGHNVDCDDLNANVGLCEEEQEESSSSSSGSSSRHTRSLDNIGEIILLDTDNQPEEQPAQKEEIIITQTTAETPEVAPEEETYNPAIPPLPRTPGEPTNQITGRVIDNEDTALSWKPILIFLGLFLIGLLLFFARKKKN